MGRNPEGNPLLYDIGGQMGHFSLPNGMSPTACILTDASGDGQKGTWWSLNHQSTPVAPTNQDNTNKVLRYKT